MEERQLKENEMGMTSSGGVLWGVPMGDACSELMIKRAEETEGLEVVHTGDFDGESVCVVPAGLSQEVDWGCEKVDPKNITPSLYQKDQLDRWCDKHGIDRAGIGLHVYSFYG